MKSHTHEKLQGAEGVVSGKQGIKKKNKNKAQEL